MKLLTYNIHGCIGMDGKRSVERIADVIRGAGADVACLQEVHRRIPWTGLEDQPKLLADLLGMRPVFQNNIRLPGGQFGNLVLSRLAVLSHASMQVQNTWERRRRPPQAVERRRLLVVVLEAPGGPLTVMTTHWSLEAEDRLAAARVVADRAAAAGTPVVVTGDFNALPGSEEMRLLAERSGLRDAGAAAGTPTFPADAPRSRIDYVWMSPGITPVSVQVVESLASDHRAVCVEW